MPKLIACDSYTWRSVGSVMVLTSMAPSYVTKLNRLCAAIASGPVCL